jgi:hypothetical protein
MCMLRKWGEALRTEMETPLPADQSPEYLRLLHDSTLLCNAFSGEDLSLDIILGALDFSDGGLHTVQFCTPAHTSR